MKKEEFFFESRDNQSRIHAVRYTPDDGNVIGVVQIIHGMAEYVERYAEFAQFLTEKGFVVTGEDHLGHGGSVGENGCGYFCEQDPATVVVRDVHRLKKLTQQIYPYVTYIILGHSMGSFILRNYLYRYGTGISGAVIMGTGMQPGPMLMAAKAVAAVNKAFFGSRHVSRFLDGLAFGSYNKRFAPARTDKDWFSRDTAVVDRYIEDPKCGFIFTVNGFQTLFELIHRCQKPENLQKIPEGLPVLIISGEEDPVGAYGEGVRKTAQAMEKSGMKRLTVRLYPAYRHELLNELERITVMEEIYDWINANVMRKFF